MIFPKDYKIIAFLLIMLSPLIGFTQGGITNDTCEKAKIIFPGAYLSNLSNEFSTIGPPGQIPPQYPQTCIESFENDLWYKFKTIQGLNWYEAIITINVCNTPAGLQAMLFRGWDCNPLNFDIVNCVNMESTDTIRLSFFESRPLQEFMIYIDGFDGTICDFNLQLLGLAEKNLTKEDYKHLYCDRDSPEKPDTLLDEASAISANNEVLISWKSNNGNDVDFFLVERFQQGLIHGPFPRIIGIVDVRNLVEGGEQLYTLIDKAPGFKDVDICYRIVPVSSKGNKKYSQDLCVHYHNILSFYAGEVLPKEGTPGVFEVRYMNRINRQNFDLSVLDEKGNKVKSFKMEKEPVRDGTVTINMVDFPLGRYTFEMNNGEERFSREFELK